MEVTNGALLSFERFLRILPGVDVESANAEVKASVRRARLEGRNIRLGRAEVSFGEFTHYFDDDDKLEHVTPFGAIRLATLYLAGELPGLKTQPRSIPDFIVLYAEGKLYPPAPGAGEQLTRTWLHRAH